MRGCVPSTFALLLFLSASSACAQEGTDHRASFGSDLVIRRGEVVRDATAFGGDVVVEGEVERDATSFGGSVFVREGGRVGGDLTSFGIDGEQPAVASAPRDRGPVETIVDAIGEIVHDAVAHVLLFLLGLFMIGPWSDRLAAMQVTILKDGLKTTGFGVLGYIAAIVGIVVLAVSIVGIPVAVVVAIALPLASYVGLAAIATVIGAALPVPQLRGREVLQLAAGVGVLFLCSCLPVVGSIATAIAACAGFGALLRTRFAKWPPKDLPDAGPYRTASV